MEHTCSECFGRGEKFLRPTTKFTNHIDGYLEGSQGASKEKVYMTRKIS